MRVFFNSRHDAHDGAGEMHHGRMVPCFENARRIPIIRDAVAHAIKAQLFDPKDHGMDPIRAIHDPDYLDFLETAWDGWTKAGNSGDAFPYVWPTAGFSGGKPEHISARLGQYAISSDTPITQGTWKAAYWGAQTVISAAEAAWSDNHLLCVDASAGTSCPCQPIRWLLLLEQCRHRRPAHDRQGREKGRDP